MPVSMQLLQRTVEERLRVAIAPVDGQVDVPARQLSLERSDQLSVLRVDRAHATEGEVVMRDLFEALSRNSAASGHSLEEGHDLIGPLRATEGGKEKGRVSHRRMSTAVAASMSRPV